MKIHVALFLAALGSSALAADAPQPAADAPKPAAKPAKSAKPAGAKPASAAAKDGFKNDDERTIYAVGFLMGRNVVPFTLSAAETKLLQAGLGDAALGKTPAVDVRFHQSHINDMLQKRMAVAAEKEKAKGKAYADKFVAAEKPTAIEGGGWYKETLAGPGAAPKPTDVVKVHYRGTLIDGTEFDSSYSRGEPATFPLNQVIPCWTHGVGMMKVGGKATLVCPSDVAYGDSGHPPTIKGGATLVFEVELIDIVKEEPKADAKDVKGGKDKKKG